MSGRPDKDGDLIPAWVNGSLQPADKMVVHRLGQRHKAVSVFLTAGPMTLIQRRALGKYHTPGLWANACCTHPHWEEAAADCASDASGRNWVLIGPARFLSARSNTGPMWAAA